MSLELVVALPQILVISSPPITSPNVAPEDGQIRLQVGSGGRCVLWIYENYGWTAKPLSPIVGYGNPNELVPSDCKHQVYLDSNEGYKQYYADSSSVGSTSWAIGGVVLGS